MPDGITYLALVVGFGSVLMAGALLAQKTRLSLPA
jgi:hypothetical protein